MLSLDKDRAQRCGRPQTRSFAPERHVPQQQVKLLNGPADILPCPLLHLILPIGINAAAFDPPSPPPLLLLARRIGEWFAKQLLDPFEPKRHLFLPAGQAIQKVAQRVVLGHFTNDGRFRGESDGLTAERAQVAAWVVRQGGRDHSAPEARVL